METIKRSSRFARAAVIGKTGRPIVPIMTDRQKELLRFLERNRYATFNDLHAFLRGDGKTLRRNIRIMKAEHIGYIRVCQQDEYERNLRRAIAWLPVHRAVAARRIRRDHLIKVKSRIAAAPLSFAFLWRHQNKTAVEREEVKLHHQAFPFLEFPRRADRRHVVALRRLFGASVVDRASALRLRLSVRH
jgi:hypothetical protein